MSGQALNCHIAEESLGGFVVKFHSFVLSLVSCYLEHSNENKCFLSWQSREAFSSSGILMKDICL